MDVCAVFLYSIERWVGVKPIRQVCYFWALCAHPMRLQYARFFRYQMGCFIGIYSQVCFCCCVDGDVADAASHRHLPRCRYCHCRCAVDD